jgi:hypothetical protein
MLERSVETELVKQVKNLGGICWKFTVPSTAGVPDRIILYNGKTYFVELKAPGKKPRPLQLKIHRDMKKQGFPVTTIDNINDVHEFISRIKGD